MKNFFTYLETIRGSIARSEIARDGDLLALPDYEDMDEEIVLNVVVEEYDEDGHLTNTRKYDAYNKELDEVLDEVESDHPAGEWENINW